MNFTALSDGTYIENDIFFPQQQGRLHSYQWLDWQPRHWKAEMART
jgi:hypothetical protein